MAEPTRALAPTRAPIEVLCDQRTAPRLANAAMRRHLSHGSGGILVAAPSLVFGVVVAASARSALMGALFAGGIGLAQLVSAHLKTRQSFQKLFPAGQLLVSRYDDRGRFTLTTAMGTAGLSRGSVDRVERRRGSVHLRTLPGRRWTLLPTELLTEVDAAFLLGPSRTSLPLTTAVAAGGPVGAATLSAPGNLTADADHLPLIHVVDPQSRRDLGAAVAGHILRSRANRALMVYLVIGLGYVAVAGDWVTFSLFGIVVAQMAATVLRAVIAERRSRPLGHLLRAAVTPTQLIVDNGDSDSRLPWASIGSCTVTRRAVLLVLRQGVILPLPRSLFPQAELAGLQQLVREHGGDRTN